MNLSNKEANYTKSVCYGRIKTLIRQTIDVLNQYEKESFRSVDLNQQEILLSILTQNHTILRDRLKELKGGRSKSIGSYVNFMEEKD